jgi:hypothetical protein
MSFVESIPIPSAYRRLGTHEMSTLSVEMLSAHGRHISLFDASTGGIVTMHNKLTQTDTRYTLTIDNSPPCTYYQAHT